MGSIDQWDRTAVGLGVNQFRSFLGRLELQRNHLKVGVGTLDEEPIFGFTQEHKS